MSGIIIIINLPHAILYRSTATLHVLYIPVGLGSCHGSCGYLPAFHCGRSFLSHVGFLVDKSALGQVFPQIVLSTSFDPSPCSYFIHLPSTLDNLSNRPASLNKALKTSKILNRSQKLEWKSYGVHRFTLNSTSTLTNNPLCISCSLVPWYLFIVVMQVTSNKVLSPYIKSAKSNQFSAVRFDCSWCESTVTWNRKPRSLVRKCPRNGVCCNESRGRTCVPECQ